VSGSDREGYVHADAVSQSTTLALLVLFVSASGSF
jgi:hypothetical protein